MDCTALLGGRSYLGASARVISSADARIRQIWRSLRLMYRHQRICSARTGSLWHGTRVGRRLSRGTTRHPVSVDLVVAPLSGKERWYADPPTLQARHKLIRLRQPSTASRPQDRLPHWAPSIKISTVQHSSRPLATRSLVSAPLFSFCHGCVVLGAVRVESQRPLPFLTAAPQHLDQKRHQKTPRSTSLSSHARVSRQTRSVSRSVTCTVSLCLRCALSRKKIFISSSQIVRLYLFSVTVVVLVLMRGA